VKVVVYLRVSTDRQADGGLGLEVQEAACREWARAAGHRIVAMTRYEGISGSNGIDTRVGLADALELLRAGKAQGLVVYRLDRLARDLVLQEQLLAEVRRMGADVFTTSSAEADYLVDDPADPSRRLIRQVLGAVNEYERAMIALRLRAGKARKIAHGGYGGGRPPYGYRAEGRDLVADEAEQAVLERIRQFHVDGHSTRSIARALAADGITCRGAARWHPSHMARIVARGKVAA
jgi:DNA invertase Pin-like site-specific DNA recombinase